MDEFIEQFLLESRELVEQATGDLLALEESPGDIDRLDGAFRAFHTLKGSAAIVDFAAMVTAAHAVEELLAQVRKGELAVSRGLIGDCLAFLNIVAEWLDIMAVRGEVPKDAGAAAQAFAKRIGQHSQARPRHPPQPSRQVEGDLSETALALLRAQFHLLNARAGAPGYLLSAGAVTANVLSACGRQDGAADVRQLTAEAAASGDPAPLAKFLEHILEAAEKPAASTAPESAARVLRVDVERVDAIVRLTGELTVAKNAIGHAAQLARAGSDPKQLADILRDQYAAIDRLTGELQRSVLAIRVLPLRFVFQRFPRLVRETAEALGKTVRLEISGEETEADKVIVENLFEPLLHLIRNALDHGIESPREREAAGKPATAMLALRAERRGDHVTVEVEDDGCGIDTAAIRAKALESGLVENAELAAMTDSDVMNLIFAAGFSTAAAVTSLSGRGVGMNAVRSAVEKMGGSVNLTSVAGAGTTVTLKLPFSVLMTRIMTVRVGGQTFGIPLDSVIETARVPRSQISAVGAAHAFVLRDRTIPVIDVRGSLGLELPSANDEEANLVVVSVREQLGSVKVDRLGDCLDVMLRPADGLLAGVMGVAGTSLMGDGTVLVVLDLQELLG